jgi:hypothetical protein
LKVCQVAGKASGGRKPDDKEQDASPARVEAQDEAGSCAGRFQQKQQVHVNLFGPLNGKDMVSWPPGLFGLRQPGRSLGVVNHPHRHR